MLRSIDGWRELVGGEEMSLNSGKLIILLIGSLLVGVLIGALFVFFSFEKRFTARKNLQIEMDNAIQCQQYWDNRSGIADAKFEFDQGRRGLIEVVSSRDPSIDYWIPALASKKTAEVRKNYPLFDPKLNLRIGPRFEHFNCDPTAYAWDYNFRMLQLLGREGEAYARPVSPELSARRGH